MFLRASIERILSETGGTRRKENAELKKACEEALERLNVELQSLGQNASPDSLDSSSAILPNSNTMFLADHYFLPFELACQSKSTKIVVNALDSLQKLISYGHLIGNQRDPENPDQLLIDRKFFPADISGSNVDSAGFVQTICAPFQGPHTDDAIQLQIIKGILALILSTTCKIHESSLLLAVRTCFNIYLASKSPIIQSTAKGILTQTINYVFNGMESALLAADGASGRGGMPLREWDQEESVIKDVLDSMVYQVSSSMDAMEQHQRQERSRHSSAEASGITPADGLSINGRYSTSPGGGGGEIPTNESNGPMNRNETEDLHSSNSNIVNGNVNGNTLGGGTTPMQQQPKLEFATLEEKDAFLIFRALCKLSIKQLPADDQDPRSHELRSKTLSLEMILLIVQNFNAQLPDTHSFVYAIRHFLCVALTHNAVSAQISVFEKALAIFVQMVVNSWKTHLKRQLEVFFKEIIISMLESASSSFEHKWAVLGAINRIFDSAQSVVDIYVNYDCHMTSANIFEELVAHLSKIASSYTSDQSSPTHGQQTMKERERRMRVMALDCLVKALNCLVCWYEEMDLGREQSIHGGEEQQQQFQLANGGSFSSVADVVQAKQQKSLIESGIELFAKKPQQGLAYLSERGFVGPDPLDIARFFHGEERLDKSVIGDYLGDGAESNQRVMFAYVDAFDFSGVNIVNALRTLLSKFRLPGEAQKIDRIMEKFASRYCECNPQLKIFASADTAYVLSYSIIMLTTDLHNPQVKRKMTKEEYIRMNRGINGQDDLPDEFLSKIYDDIATNEIKTKPSNLKRPKLNAATASLRQRKLFQNLELESISQVAHSLMEAATMANTEFTTASHFEQVQLMFELIWSFCLAAFSIGLQSSEEHAIWSRCLQGFSAGVRVACLFRLGIQREAFVQTLTKFTLLTANSSLSEMRQKNVDTIKLLIHIGVENGNYLEQCWYDVLKCISQLELVQSIGTGNHENLKSMFNIRDKSIHAVQSCLGETSSQDVVVAIDRIFQDSNKLTGDAIIHFVRALCQVSLEELCSPGGPSMFMLQKIVEISFYNMGRIRIEWSMIWSILGEHFNLAGCSSNGNISHFALEALRQLSMKFLEKGELPNFRFQKEFLHPFEVIMDRNRSLACREMIVTCIAHMVHSHADKIRSGWKNIFSLFGMAATEKDERIIEQAFTTTSEIITNVFPNHFGELSPDSFHDSIKCLSEFACNPTFPDTSMEAIRLIRLAAALVDKHTELINTHWGGSSASGNSETMGTGQKSQPAVWIKGWLPIIFELSCIINRCKLDVRTRSLTVLFELVKSYGDKFGGADAWSDLFKIIFRIFDFGKISELGNENTSKALKELCKDFVERRINRKKAFEQNLYENGGNEVLETAIEEEEEEKEILIKKGRKEGKKKVYMRVPLLMSKVMEKLEIFEKESPEGKKQRQKGWLEKQPSLTRAQVDLMEKNEWMVTTCNHALYAIVDVFSEYYASLGALMLPEVYKQLFWCVQQGNELLARSAINCFENLVSSNGTKFTSQMWDQTVEQLARIFDCSIVDINSIEKMSELPTQNGMIVSSSTTNSAACPSSFPDSGSPIEENNRYEDCVLLSSITRCIVQLEVVDAVSNILFGRNAFKVEGPTKRSSSTIGDAENGPNGANLSEDSLSLGELPSMFQRLSTQNLLRLVECLLRSHTMAKHLAANAAAQRNLVWKATFKGRAKPNLQKMEAHSMHCALNILFQLYAQTTATTAEPEMLPIFKEKLQRTVKYALGHYLSSHSDTFRSYWLTVVQMILNRTSDLPHERFAELGLEFRLSLTSLIESDEQPIIRSALHRVVQRLIMTTEETSSRAKIEKNNYK